MLSLHSNTRISKALLLTVTVFILASIIRPSSAWSWETPVQQVHDGDTIEVIRKGPEVDVRFYGNDCPEKDQPYGMKAKRFVKRMCRGKIIDVQSHGQDCYGRIIGMIYINGKSLNEALVINGLAWVYDRYCNKRICDNWQRRKPSRGCRIWLVVISKTKLYLGSSP